jgi:hypothetical protein
MGASRVNSFARASSNVCPFAGKPRLRQHRGVFSNALWRRAATTWVLGALAGCTSTSSGGNVITNFPAVDPPFIYVCPSLDGSMLPITDGQCVGADGALSPLDEYADGGDASDASAIPDAPDDAVETADVVSEGSADAVGDIVFDAVSDASVVALGDSAAE